LISALTRTALAMMALMLEPETERNGAEEPLVWVQAQPGQARLEVAQRMAHDAAPHGMRLLRLFAYDPQLDVRMAALSSALQRCPHVPPGLCGQVLISFAEERSAPGAWLARRALLRASKASAPWATLEEDKLELIARLTAQLGRPHQDPLALPALHLLAEDTEPEVQEAAAAALMAHERLL
jgi:hypothetical protein